MGIRDTKRSRTTALKRGREGDSYFAFFPNPCMSFACRARLFPIEKDPACFFG